MSRQELKKNGINSGRITGFQGGRHERQTAFFHRHSPAQCDWCSPYGHALNNVIQDIMCRYRRLLGYNVLWMPGTDHAGIATQNVVERDLAARGKNRDQLGREAFIQEVWKWKEKSGGAIINQLKRLGASCDWDRERFTMDEGLSDAVRKVFVRLYKEGLIYEGQYIINWCPRCFTALADLEVEYEEQDSYLYYIRYPFKGQKKG